MFFSHCCNCFEAEVELSDLIYATGRSRKLRIPFPPIKMKIGFTNGLTQIQLAAHEKTRRSSDSCDSTSVNNNKHRLIRSNSTDKLGR